MKLWHNNGAGAVFLIFFEYIRDGSVISEEMYVDVRAFIRYFHPIHNSGLEYFWEGVRYSTMRDSLDILVRRLEKNHKQKTEEFRRTNMIILEICLTICAHPKFQHEIKQMYDGLQVFHGFQLRITRIGLKLYFEDSARFELNNGYYIKKLREFMSLPNQKEILAYVITVLICLHLVNPFASTNFSITNWFISFFSIKEIDDEFARLTVKPLPSRATLAYIENLYAFLALYYIERAFQETPEIKYEL